MKILKKNIQVTKKVCGKDTTKLEMVYNKEKYVAFFSKEYTVSEMKTIFVSNLKYQLNLLSNN